MLAMSARAGLKSIRRATPKGQVRVGTRQSASDAEVLGITRGWILAELREVLEQAKDHGKLGPANRALELLAKLRGDMIARTESTVEAVHLVINGVNVEDLT